MSRSVLVALVGLACGCGAASPSLGLQANVRVADAQYVPGAMPASTDGPQVLSASLGMQSFVAGWNDQTMVGTLDPLAASVAIGLDGDAGYWIVVAGVPETEAPTIPTFHASLSFAASMPHGPATIVTRAVDRDGNFGPPRPLSIEITSPPAPEGALVISLEWDTPSDLDLHVHDPNGVELWSRSPGSSRTPGRLDADSNAHCAIDGRNQENVVYPTAPPSGIYQVRVDVPSLCSAVVAHWRVEVLQDGTVTQSSAGTFIDSDTRGNHDQGAGLIVLELVIP
jgi:hypothetical protein